MAKLSTEKDWTLMIVMLSLVDIKTATMTVLRETRLARVLPVKQPELRTPLSASENRPVEELPTASSTKEEALMAVDETAATERRLAASSAEQAAN